MCLLYEKLSDLNSILSTQNFSHEGYKNHKTLWMLDSVANLEEFVYCVNEAQRGMVEDIIQQFKSRVLDNSNQFPKQQIHGDFNEQNILVGKKEGKVDYSVIGELKILREFSLMIFFVSRLHRLW
jgi:Ser/Thr protein kinase RdoA (MazF antagonist)